ncbi:AMP-binding protein [Oscillatoria sp. CS-180]|uniref:AMP-binding protein n=1 Tax=Oscillatoria sp. CS-180 TaxID=3021720 RepID=UPI00232AA986|nr:AMP-binding protein [Oscillatoria sp. CS-180]MDB9529236.1 AMP-binding protein [Oscillatoria sp. CS-180]
MSKVSSKAFNQVATLVDLLEFRADHQPEATAYDFFADGENCTASITYHGLAQAVRAVATLLQGLGSNGKPVLLLYPPGMEYLVAFLGCSYAGAIAVPAYPPRPNRSLERLQVMIQDAGAAIALTHSTVLNSLEKRFLDYPFLKKLHWLATDSVDTTLAASWHHPQVGADDLALLQYTSGSTGNPKGVKVSQGNLIHNSARIHRFFEHSEASRGMSWLPPYHDMGLVGGILQPLYAGMNIALMPPVAFLQKPVRWLQIVSRYGATTSGGPNFAYDLCVQKTTPEQRAELDLSQWQVAFSGAEPVRANTLEEFAAAFEVAGFHPEAFYPCYGMAETTLIVTGGNPRDIPEVHHIDEVALQHGQATPVPDGEGQTIVSCGYPSEDQELLIVNPETCQVCPDGQVGEIWVAVSGSVTQGYWQQPERTAETFHAFTQGGQGPFLRTGDLGFVQAGALFVTGRRKELIIIRGRNYYPKDIETTIETSHEALQPGAGAAFSVMIDHQERLAVVQEVKRTYLRHFDGDEVLGEIRQAIAEQHDLQLFGLQLIKTGSLPKTSSGKIQRFQCRTSYLDGQLPVVYSWQIKNANSISPPAEGATTEAVVSQEATPEAVPIAADSPQAAEMESSTHEATTVQSSDELRRLMTTWLAQELNIPVTDIDVHRPFAEYGLDSVAAVELTDVLQTAANRSLSPTLAYEYPTIEAVANYLGTQFEQPISEEKAKVEEDDLAALMNELEDLSEADVKKLLEQQES